MKTQSMKDLILQMPFAKVIELHNPVIPVYKCMYYFPQPAVNLYLTDNTRGGTVIGNGENLEKKVVPTSQIIEG